MPISVGDSGHVAEHNRLAGVGAVKDPRWNVLSGQTTVDEFNDSSIGASWVRVDNGANSSRVVWTEDGDVLSFSHNATADTAGEEHAYMFPLSSAGGSMAVSDAFVAAMQVHRPASTAGPLALGMVLADGITYGSGLGIGTMMNGTATATTDTHDFRTLDAYNSGGTGQDTLSRPIGKLFYIRFAQTASNVWRRDYSEDGVSWQLGGTTIAKTFTPTYVGFWCSNWGSATAFHGSIEFLRRVTGIS